jgi:hypothetical protein
VNDAQDLGDLRAVVARERDVRGADVLLDALGTAGAGDRDDVVATREQPRERGLGDRGVLGRGEVLEVVDGSEVLPEVAGP